MSRTATIASVLAVSLLCMYVLAEPGVVVTRDGATYEGDIREEETDVVVTLRGIETVIPRANVLRIEYKAAYDADFAERLANLEPTDISGRVALAREAFDQRRYDLALAALNDALRIDPNHHEAFQFRELVERQIRLERAAQATPADRAAPAPRPAPPERRLLSTDDINIIRQKELRPADAGVRISIPAELRRRFAERQRVPFAEFNRLSPVQQALQIIERGDEEMRRQLRITSDPPALAEYKRIVQPVVLSGCATTGCHGGPGGGNFMLFTPADADAVSYTNFYILTQYNTRVDAPDTEGVFGPAVRGMIERGQAERSVLLNYGLPTTTSDYDHPQVGGRPVQPIFRNRDDPRYRQIVNWMNNVLSPITPVYGIEYTPPRPAGEPPPPPDPVTVEEE